MKRNMFLGLLAIAFCITITSCATVRGGGGGCKMNQGYVGYGGH